MKKILILLVLSFVFSASLPTVPHDFESRKIIPASWLNDNFDSANNAVTDGTSKINVAEIEINGSTLIDDSKVLSISGFDVTGDISVDGTATIGQIEANGINVSGNIGVSGNINTTGNINVVGNIEITGTMNVNTINATYIDLTGKTSILEQGGTLIDFYPTQYKLDTDVMVYSYYTPSVTSNLIEMEGRLIGTTWLKDGKDNTGSNRPTVTLCFPVPANTTFDVKITSVSGSGNTIYKKWGK